jgi:hypothetical protein
LREESRLRVFENRVLRRIFGPRREDMIGEWRKQHNEELNCLYSSPSIVQVIKSRKMIWAGLGERRGVYRVLVGKPERKKPMRTWEDNIKVNLQDVGCGGYGLDRAGSG